MVRLLVFLLALSAMGQASAQDAAPDAASAQQVAVEQQAPSEEDAVARLAARYEARLDAMEMANRTFDRAVQVGSWLGLFMTGAAIVFAFLFGRSLSEVHRTAEDNVKLAIAKEIQRTTEEADSLKSAIADVQQIFDQLASIKERLSGYTDLAEVVETASDFDPLVYYYELDREIDLRFAKSIQLQNGADGIRIADTIQAPEFRQRAALIFEKIIRYTQNLAPGAQIKIEPNKLYNIAASASKADFDFVALELMEQAERLSQGAAPEISSRLVRQRVTMFRISSEEAQERIAQIIGRTTGFDLHLVLSEAHNIGIRTAQPSRVADLILNSVAPEFAEISYLHLTVSGLKRLGSAPEDWAASETHFARAVTAFANESNSARWFTQSAADIAKAVVRRNAWLDLGQPSARETLSRFDGLEEFRAFFGHEALVVLGQAGLLEGLLGDRLQLGAAR